MIYLIPAGIFLYAIGFWGGYRLRKKRGVPSSSKPFKIFTESALFIEPTSMKEAFDSSSTVDQFIKKLR